jgi:ABC-2 type transport system permease protein
MSNSTDELKKSDLSLKISTSTCKAISTIFRREFMGYFRTPVAYVFIVVFLMASNGLTWFLTRIFERNNASLVDFFQILPWVYLFLIPAVGMRLWAEEKRAGTWELLFTYPVTVHQAVIAKFLSGWAFIAIAITSTFTLPLTVEYLGNPDWGPIFTGYIGSLLMAGAYLSICSLTSSLTKNQVISFVVAVSLCLIFVLIGFGPFNDLLLKFLPINVVDGISSFSFITHFESMMVGLITLSDMAFFVTIIAFCLWVNAVVLER